MFELSSCQWRRTPRRLEWLSYQSSSRQRSACRLTSAIQSSTCFPSGRCNQTVFLRTPAAHLPVSILDEDTRVISHDTVEVVIRQCLVHGLSRRRSHHGLHRPLYLRFPGLERFSDQELHALSSRAPICDGQRMSPQSWRCLRWNRRSCH